MTITTSETRIDLSENERDALIKALEILKEVNKAINSNDIDYVVDRSDMLLYDETYEEIGRIEEYVRIA